MFDTIMFGGAYVSAGRAGGVVLARVFLAACLLSCPAASAGESPLAIVVLPPGFVSGGGPEATVAAELACDRLARELAGSPSLRVVDRAQLDRVLKERRLGPGPAGGIVGYDIMARLEVDAVRPVPRVRLKLVDLSDGNLLAEARAPWSVPLPDGAIRNMAQTCLAAAREVAGPSPEALRVRLLEVDNTARSARLDPLATRLRQTVENALGRSKGVRLVHHFEARTAKEEALLLVMGMARLPGGRRFVPQSDATIELRIREVDGVGKTFEQTRVEVGWRVRKGSGYRGQWATARAVVKDFDGLVKAAWAGCAGALGRASPQAGVDYLAEMALRRKQARAELDASRMEGARNTAAASRRALAHAAAAAKLDPTWEEAAYALVLATPNARPDGVDYDIAAYGAGIHEALRYLRRFRSSRRRRTILANRAMFWAGSRLVALRRMEDVELTAADRDALDALKEIVDIAVAGAADELPALTPTAMHLVYRGMTLTGVDRSQRRQWMDRVIRLGERGVSPTTCAPSARRHTLLERKMRFRLYAARLLVAEGDPEATRPYVEELLALIPAAKLRGDSYIAAQARRCIEEMRAPDLLARLDARVGPAVVIRPTRIDSPNDSPPRVTRPAGTRIRAPVRAMRYGKFTVAAPLAVCAGRMICVIQGEKASDKSRVGAVDLDGQGRPAGKITLLPTQPPAQRPMRVTGKAVWAGKLYLGTEEGLLEYDPAKGAWRTFGPKQGLPGWNVYTVVALDDGTLFCHVGDKRTQGFFCKVNPSTSRIRLVRRLVHQRGRNPLVDTGLAPAWRAGDRIVGLMRGSHLVALPGFGAGEPVRRKWPATGVPGRRNESLPDGMAVIRGRRFVMYDGFFREIRDDGVVLRTWARSRPKRPTGGPGNLPGLGVVVPPDRPHVVYGHDYGHIAQDASHVFFLSDRILCFDPAGGTWYGPLETEPWTNGPGRVASGSNGVWFSSGRHLVYLHAADFIAAAGKAGRVVTSEMAASPGN